MKTIITTLAVITLIGMNAMANNEQIRSRSSDSIVADVVILNNTVTAEGASDTVHSYVLKTQNGQQSISMRGTGKLASLNQTSNEARNIVMGKDVQGYAQITVKSAGDDKLVLGTDENLSSQTGNVKLNMALKMDQNAVITKGTWDSYTKGGEIEFQLTADAEKAGAKETGKQLSDAIETSLKQSLPSVNFDSQVLVKDGDSSTVCKASLRKLECFESKVQIQIIMDAYGL
jgi:hypothetical protein